MPAEEKRPDIPLIVGFAKEETFVDAPARESVISEASPREPVVGKEMLVLDFRFNCPHCGTGIIVHAEKTETNQKLQCKDIPDRPILEFLARRPDDFHNWVWNDDKNVRLAMPLGIPDKLVLAKMRQLVKRGLVAGCVCGCRGDFQITEKGKEFLTKEENKT